MSATDKGIRQTVIIYPDCREAFLPESPDGRLARHGVELAGISVLKTRYIIAREAGRFHVVFVSLDGTGWLEAGTVDRAVGAGELFVVPAGTAHEYRLAGASWTACWFHLADDRPWDDPGPARVETLDRTAAAALRALMEEYLAECASSDARSGRAATAIAELMTIRLARLIRPPADVDPSVKRLRAALDEAGSSLARDWNVGELAILAGLSARQFHRDCLRLYGETPGTLLTRLRLDRAAEYLRATDYPLAAIAELTGFANPYALSNAYRRDRGIRPSEERKDRP
ncbi:MAG: hypothetical protein A2413_03315 [Treponema sp. RIFOXYC1_FULL_61_9]|nr:MAG: hypothetical protein A2413_03315 [Treponema sp. RIFOXYC1_FULL_61_9]